MCFMFWKGATPEIRERGVRERERALQLEQECASLRFLYVTIELDVAITFCQIAASATNIPAKSRALARAARAYEMAEYYKNNTGFTETMQADIERRELRLNALLVVTRSRAGSA